MESFHSTQTIQFNWKSFIVGTVVSVKVQIDKGRGESKREGDEGGGAELLS